MTSLPPPPAAFKGQKIRDQVRAFVGAFFDHCDHPPGLFILNRAFQHRRREHDGRERIIEFVRDTSGQQA